MDYVQTTVLKGAADVFGHIIANLSNLLFSVGVFPRSFKVGQVTPLLKKPGTGTTDMANFRLITILNTIGIILERLAMTQMRSHMGNSPNLASQQSAYRALHSTETAMTRVVSDLLAAIDSGSPSVLLSLDISAAFDTLDHRRLLERAKELFGFDCVVIRWLALYLAGHDQFAVVVGCRSRTEKAVPGVTQVPVLGQLLFSIFTTPVGSLISTFSKDTEFSTTYTCCTEGTYYF